MMISVNGVRLFLEVLGPKLKADGPLSVELPTVIALHGGPSDHGHMYPMVAALRNVAQVVMYDHRGCGRSESGDPSLWRMEQWADDVVAVCEALGIEKPIVYGHSFGGMVALQYGVRHPGHASKLILSATCSRWDTARSVEGFRTQGGDVAAEAFEAWVAHPNPETTDDFIKNCRQLYTVSRKTDPDAEARTITNIPLLFDFFDREVKQFDLSTEMSRVVGPVMILGGDEDPVLPPPYQDEIQAGLTNAQVTRHSFPNCGHTLGGDAPDALAQALVDFINS
jgi:proline iminopeptidase